MKLLLNALCVSALFIGRIALSQTNVIVDDTWPTGVYTNWNLPFESPWYYNSSSTNLYMGAITNELIMTNYDSSQPTLVSGTRYFWTYFTTNAPQLTLCCLTYTNPVSNGTNSIYGFPVSLAVGQMITVTMNFTPSGFIEASGTKGLRMGLMNYGTNTPWGRAARSTSNISKSGTNVSGYLLEIPLFTTINNSMFSFRVRTNLNASADSLDPLGKTDIYGSLGGGPALTNVPGFVPEANYTMQFSVSRYATANVLSANLSGPLAGVSSTNFSQTVSDAFGQNWSDFDAFLIRIDSSSLVCDRLGLLEFKVETSALPPLIISTADFLDPNDFRLRWNSVSGQNYRIDSTANLSPPNWISNATVTATGRATDWTNSGASALSQNFYRVVNTP